MAVIAAVALCAGAQDTSKENMVRDRGQTRTARPGQSLDRGRFGSQPDVPLEGPWLNGILVDASCMDRSLVNLRRDPESLQEAVIGNPAVPPAEKNQGGESAAGVSVSPEAIRSERSVATPNHVPDLRARQSDPSCGITAQTHLFALVTDNGRLLNLDEGGNTFALNAFQSTRQGKAILEGNAFAAKPRVRVQARVRGGEAVVRQLSIVPPGRT